MPANRLKTDEFMVRWAKKDGLKLRALAARLRTTPAKLLSQALKLGLDSIEALTPKSIDDGGETGDRPCHK